MKILKIHFKNINSLKGEQHIDFDAPPLSENNLFAITGSTGSGKSTILDVISLALYNEIPRFGKVSKEGINKTGAILTKNQSEAHATVVYECKEGTFQSTWSIHRAKTGNLQDYNMEIARYPDGDIVEDKKSNVPNTNKNLIGLSYEQFVKSVMLAQGAFAEFLRIPTKERAALLEKITGTSIYREIGKKVYEKYRDVSKLTASIDEKMSIYAKDILEEEEYTSLTNEIKELTETISSKEEQSSKLQDQIREKGNQLTKQSALEKVLKNIDIIRQQVQNFEDQEDKGKALIKHEQLEPYLEDINNYQNLEQTISTSRKDKVERQQRLSGYESDMEKYLAEATALAQIKMDLNSYKEVLTSFRADILKIESQVQEKTTAHRTISDDILSSLNDIEITPTPNLLNELNEKIATLEKQSEADKKIVGDVAIEDLDALQTQLDKERDKLKDARNAQAQFSAKTNEIDRLQETQKQAQLLMDSLPEKITGINHAVELLSKDEEILKAKQENQRLTKSLEEHRHTLEDGKPCPLCGALEHPYATDLPQEENELDKQLVEVRRDLDQKKKEYNESNQLLSIKQDELKSLKAQSESLQKERSALSKSITQLMGKHEETYDYETNIRDLEQRTTAIDDYEKVVREIKDIHALLPKIEKSNRLKSEKNDLIQKKNQKYGGDNIQNDVDNLINKISATLSRKEETQEYLTALDKKLQSDSGQLQVLADKLQAKLQAINYDTVTAAIADKLPHDTLTSLRKEKKSFDEALAENTTKKEVYQRDLESFPEVIVKMILSDGQAQHEALKSALAVYRDKKETLNATYQQHKEKLKDYNELKEEKKTLSKDSEHLKILNDMIGDAQGVKFNNFAQELTLKHLLHIANEHLHRLSDRYVIDQADAEEDESLTIVDRDMGNQRRSVKTLSGGETFIVSLSLALALSDFSSKNVEINSLFIDEGFGTLDAETLDKTIDTLERLQQESDKMIGIISHVPTLKERIATQIQLSKNGQGYSTIEIV